MKIQVALQAFLLQLSADGRSPHTIGQYRRHVRTLIEWLVSVGASTNVKHLTPELLARFFADGAAKNSCRGGLKKATSLNAMRTSIRCFAAHLHDAGHVGANPARLLRRARCTPPLPKALHPDEKERLLEILAATTGREATRDLLLIELLLGSGIRLGSALALDVGDIDFAHGEILLRSTKNNRPCTAILPVQVAEKVQEFLKCRTSGPVFMAKGRRISMRHAQRRISNCLAKAGIVGKSAHAFRHSFATSLLASTGDLRLVQAALNHASIVSTTIYVAVDQAKLRAAVGA